MRFTMRAGMWEMAIGRIDMLLCVWVSMAGLDITALASDIQEQFGLHGRAKQV